MYDEEISNFDGSYIPQRWITVLILFLGFLVAFAMRVFLPLVITKMVVPSDDDESTSDECPDDNSTIRSNTRSTTNGTNLSVQLFDWDETTQGIILSSVHWTCLLTNILGDIVIDSCGSKHTLSISILFTSILTLVTPISISYGGYFALISVRMLIGLVEGATYPALSVLMARWIPEDERARAGAVVFAGMPFGFVLGMSMTGLILDYEQNDWPIAFYFFGCIGLVVLILHLLLCYNGPKENPFISVAELEYLSKRIDYVTNEESPPTPWQIILKSKPVWAIIILTMANSWAFTTVCYAMPKYLSNVLKFSVRDNGIVSSIPYVCMWLFGFISSAIADPVVAKKQMEATTVRKIGAVFSSIGPGLLWLAIPYAGCNGFLVVLLLTMGMALSGCICCSLQVNTLDLGPNYVGALTSLVTGVGGISCILSPYFTGIMTPNQTFSEFKVVFWIMLIALLVGSVVYVIFGSGEIQPWNDPEFVMKAKQDRKEKSTRKRSAYSTGTFKYIMYT
ncbi:hypothetical protein QAD02_009926 [Eretmocerus hayati]|uniref:Uncharacterized protein n=1 Tax=Eretmocerus hayati TaxID=131215 RepID=A0ACC2NBE4_9HYME|nr:hypothetical protein QAD02_009926 [Eretmocerus hayati]